jgi:hypothetical protein
MSRPIPATRRCAAPFSRRIELQPSLRAASLAVAWICAFGGMTLCALELSLPARIAICVCAATASQRAIQSVFLLRGPNAIREIRCNQSGQMFAILGRSSRELSVALAPGSFRLGRRWLLLWLQTCDGVHGVFIDSGAQDPKDFRALCRRLQTSPNGLPGEQDPAS